MTPFGTDCVKTICHLWSKHEILMIHEDEIDTMQQRLDDDPDIPVLRKQTVEHPFGTIKVWMGATHFLMKRKKNVSIGMNLHVLAYNLKRMMTIMGTTGLMEAISQ